MGRQSIGRSINDNEWQAFVRPVCYEELSAVRRLTRNRAPKYHWFTGLHRQIGNRCTCGYYGPKQHVMATGQRRGAPAQEQQHTHVMCPLVLQAFISGPMHMLNFKQNVLHVDPFTFTNINQMAQFDTKLLQVTLELKCGLEISMFVSELSGVRENFIRVGKDGPQYEVQEDDFQRLLFDAWIHKGNWKKGFRNLPHDIKEHIRAEIRIYTAA